MKRVMRYYMRWTKTMKKPEEDFETLIKMYASLKRYAPKVGDSIYETFVNVEKALSIFHGRAFDQYLKNGTIRVVPYIRKTSQKKYRLFKGIIERHRMRRWQRASSHRQVIFDSLECASTVVMSSDFFNMHFENRHTAIPTNIIVSEPAVSLCDEDTTTRYRKGGDI